MSPPPDRAHDAALAALPDGHRVGDDVLADPEVAARLLQAIPSALLLIDASGRVRIANRAFHLLFGTEPDALIGRPWEEAAGGLLATGTVGELVRGGLADGARGFPAVELPIRLAGRGERWCRLEGIESPSVRAGHRLLLLVIDDITDVREIRLAADAWRTELERSNRELEQFASVAAHDLQEPVRKILAFGERLQRALAAADDPEVRRNLDRVLSAAERARTLIGGVLSLSRASTRPLAIERVALDEVMRDVLADLETQLERTGGRVLVEPLPVVRGDPVLLRQLFQNLVSNGLKFAREGVPPEVRVSARPEDAVRPVWFIEVRDNGIGFESRFAERIFQPFTRLNPRGAREGTGIGLALCHRIAARHGGSIAAASIPGEGATFVVTLPREGPEPSA